MAQPVEHEPGTHYRYSTPSTYMLSAIVERVSGMNLVEFLMPTLFEPLGIGRPVWETCPLGVAAGGIGLSLPTGAVAKFGQMLLQNGGYAGRRIVSADYIRLAAAEQSDNREGVNPERIDSAQGYGYQFHLCRFGAYRGDGSFGQLCLVSPKHDLVAAANCAFPSMSGLQPLLDWIFELAGEKDANTAASSRLWTAAAPEPPRASPAESVRSASDSAAREVCAGAGPLPFQTDTTYKLDDNPVGLRFVRFRSSPGNRPELHLDYGDERSGTLPFDPARPLESRSVFAKDLSLHLQSVVISARRPDESTLELTLRYIETPYVVIYTIRSQGDIIVFRYDINVSFGFKHYESIGYPV
ncbi:serine hydrolase [Saccharibacillus sp. CPCC 101409]|nr:serine hydrolase [Saccharibacillus sp. CPCC 101409]MDO3408143.1 serine hydrolase [Saccharibacillus sp. CPCC 101409]